MFAYVKFVEGPSKDKKCRVSVSSIKHNFKDYNKYDKRRKYLVENKSDGKFYKAIVIFFDETIEGVEKKKTKRHVIPPSKHLDTASERDSEQGIEDGASIKMFKTSIQTKNAKDIRMKKYASLLNTKYENLNKCFKENEENDALKEKDTNASSFSIQTNESESQVAVNQCDTGDKDTFTPVEQISSSHADPQTTNSTSGDLFIKSCVKLSEKDSSKIIKSLQDQVVKLKKKVSTLEKDKEKVHEKYKQLQIEYEDIMKKFTKLSDINLKMQEDILEAFNENKYIADKQKESVVSRKDGFLAVGYIRQSDNSSNSASQFVGYLLTAVFGIQELTKKTISGKQSNRNAKQRKETSKDKGIGKLDPIKLEAVKDYFCYWLQTEWDMKEGSQEFLEEKAKFKEYCTKKISYLKRPQRLSKKRGDKEEHSGNEDNSKEEAEYNKENRYNEKIETLDCSTIKRKENVNVEKDLTQMLNESHDTLRVSSDGFDTPTVQSIEKIMLADSDTSSDQSFVNESELELDDDPLSI